VGPQEQLHIDVSNPLIFLIQPSNKEDTLHFSISKIIYT